MVDSIVDGVQWRTSSRSGATGNCVQVARLAHAVAVRDSKHPAGPVLEFSPVAWSAFVRAAKGGEFDLDAGPSAEPGAGPSAGPTPAPGAGPPTAGPRTRPAPEAAQPGTRPTAAKVADHSGLA